VRKFWLVSVLNRTQISMIYQNIGTELSFVRAVRSSYFNVINAVLSEFFLSHGLNYKRMRKSLKILNVVKFFNTDVGLP